MKKLAYIDSLRGLAILLVILIHSGNYGIYGEIDYGQNLKLLLDQGAKGVQLFFIISAFTIQLSYSRSSTSNSDFFLKRFFRIAPMYYLAIGYFLWQDRLGPRWWTGYEQSIDIFTILANISFLHWLNPYWINSLVPGGWSISLEFSFYMMIPFIIKYVNSLNRALQFTTIALLISFVFSKLFLLHPFIENEILWGAYLSLYLPNHLFAFGFGFIAFQLIINRDYDFSVSTLLGLTSTWMVVAFFGTNTDYVISAVLFTLILIFLSKKPLPLLENKLMRAFGKISYSAYFIHFIILHWFSKFNLTDVLPAMSMYGIQLELLTRFILVAILSLFLSQFTFKYVERPFISLAKHIIKKDLPTFNNVRLRQILLRVKP